MAALMPGAERGVSLVERGLRSTSLGVDIDGKPVDRREDRVALLRSAHKDALVECKLEDLIPIGNTLRRKLDAQTTTLAFITSGEIDQLAENVSPVMARQAMNQAPGNLRRAIATLGSCGFETIVISADHGYLFGEEVSEGQKIDAPGGDQLELHRRVWIGRGGAATPGVLRMSASDLGLGGDLELATPRSTAVFTMAGGAGDYYHGGISLQELVIPVLRLVRSGAGRNAPAAAAALQWTIQPGGRVISTRFFSATVSAVSTELLPVTPPCVRTELWMEIPGSGPLRIAEPVSSTDGFDQATGEVQLALMPDAGQQVAPNTITFHITAAEDEGLRGTAWLTVSDVLTGRELSRYENIPVGIDAF